VRIILIALIGFNILKEQFEIKPQLLRWTWCCHRIGFNILKEQFEIKPQPFITKHRKFSIGFNILKEQFEIKPQQEARSNYKELNWF